MHPKRHAILLSLSALVFSCSEASATETTIPRMLPRELRTLTVQYGGRWMPLDTLARQIVATVTGELRFRDEDSLALLCAWTFDPLAWRNEPLILVSQDDRLRLDLQLPLQPKRFSYNALAGHPRLRAVFHDLANRNPNTPLTQLDEQVSRIGEKLVTLQNVFNNNVIMAIPDPIDQAGKWNAIPWDTREARLSPVSSAWHQLRSAFRGDDQPGMQTAVDSLAAALADLPAAHRPSARLLDSELRFNRLHPFRLAWQLMIATAILASAGLYVRSNLFDAFVIVCMASGFGILTYGLSLRWEIAGRVPASNMYESLLFLSWGTGAFALVSMLIRKERTLPLTATLIGAIALIIADCVLPASDQFIHSIPPVLLDTVWMSIHVPIIMASYSVLALAMLIAHVQLITMAITPSSEASERIDSMHYWYVLTGSFLLLVGIITGSAWASSSWGRYWGWDPKEVWSLIALCAYLTILHKRAISIRLPTWSTSLAAAITFAVFACILMMFSPITESKAIGLAASLAALVFFLTAHGKCADAVKSITAFWMIIMTYLGVNYVLSSGLHSYGFGNGAVAARMMTVGQMDLAFVIVCSLVYLARRRSTSSLPTPAQSG